MSEEYVSNEIEAEVPVQEEQVEAQEDQAQEVEESTDKKPEAEEEGSEDRVLRLAQEKAGKAIAGQRKVYAQQIEQLKRENELLRNSGRQAPEPAQDEVQYDPNRMVFDKVTKRYYSFDDPNPAGAALAAQVWREQQGEVLNKESETKKLYEDMAAKIVAGNAAYEDYEDALNTFREMGNDHMASALVSVEDPAKIVNYLGKNPHEIERLSQVPPHLVGRKIYELEMILKDSKKTVSKAAPPVRDFGQPANKTIPADQQSYEQREAYWRSRLNPER